MTVYVDESSGIKTASSKGMGHMVTKRKDRRGDEGKNAGSLGRVETWNM